MVEVGPGPGRTTDWPRTRVARLRAVELDPALAGVLRDRLGGTNVEAIEADARSMPFDDDCFTGAVSFTMLHHALTASAQDRLLAEVCRVLRPDPLLVASDSLASDGLRAFHDGDVYNPLDPDGLPDHLVAAGFTDVAVRIGDEAWAAHARAT